MDKQGFGQFDLHRIGETTSGRELNQILQRIEILSRTMVASGVESDPDASLNMFLRGVGEAFEADRAYVFEFTDDGTCDNTFEWCASGVTPEYRRLQHVPTDLIRDWVDAFRAGQGFMIDNMDAYRATNPQAYESLSLQSIDRLVVAPITLEGRLHGFVGVDNPDENLMHVCMSVFSMAANYIAVMLRHRRNFDYIQTSQNTDVLTGLQSMGSFNRSLETIIKRVASGEETRDWDVLYFNVRGFKEYNINYGFAEGDALLRRMADVLSIVVDDERVTRYEADHFYALVEDQYAELVVKQVHNAMANSSKQRMPVGAGVYHITGKEQSAGQAVDRTKIAGDAAYGDYFEYWRYYDPRMEEEISELDDAEKKDYLDAMGVTSSGLDKLIAASYRILGLISYLTAGEKETRAWTIKKGTKAPQAAGKIHSDFERGFIRAEVINYQDLLDCGSSAVAREKGLIRLEGKDYVMQDGDVVVFRFNV